MHGPPVTIAVVSWNTRELLLACLQSLGPEVDAGRASVWVVDNASDDGSAEAAREAAPWAAVIEAGENLGFGRAVNLVAQRTRSEWIVAANADIAIEPGALEALLQAGDDPRTAVVAPRLVLPSGATQHSVHPFPTVPFTLCFNLGLLQRSHRTADRLCLEEHWDPDRARTVPWAIGALLLIRRSAFDAVGAFDSRQWMYAEDLDLAWRLHDAGWATRYVPEARVCHHESAATDPAFGAAKTERFMAATYGVLVRRRGLLRTWTTALIGYSRARAGLALSRSPEQREFYGLWAGAHRRGLRSRAALLRDG